MLSGSTTDLRIDDIFGNLPTFDLRSATATCFPPNHNKNSHAHHSLTMENISTKTVTMANRHPQIKLETLCLSDLLNPGLIGESGGFTPDCSTLDTPPVLGLDDQSRHPIRVGLSSLLPQHSEDSVNLSELITSFDEEEGGEEFIFAEEVDAGSKEGVKNERVLDCRGFEDFGSLRSDSVGELGGEGFEGQLSNTSSPNQVIEKLWGKPLL